jgi:hypothetical protein
MATHDYNHACLFRFARDENEYSLREAIVRKLVDRPRFSICPLSISRITMVKLLLTLMKE